MSITVVSPAFEANEIIPKQYTADGTDSSPPISWSGLPEGTRELALIMDDPDAPTPEPWVHWVIYRIPADAQELPEGVPPTEQPSAPAGVLQGRNSWDSIGYRGPAPPGGSGVHHYHFQLFALDTPLGLSAGRDEKRLLSAIEGHVLARGELVGVYEP